MEHISTTQPVYLDGMPGSDNIVHKPNEKSEPQHEYVEIGGLKWATMNVGAKSETEAGLLFEWGDPQNYPDDKWGDSKAHNKWYDKTTYQYTKYIIYKQTVDGYVDGKDTLDPEDDAVTVNWGGSWRMPTKEEYLNLYNATNHTFVNDYEGSGVCGILLVDKNDDSKRLFFPCIGKSAWSGEWSGSIWLSTLSSMNQKQACCASFSVQGIGNNSFSTRTDCMCVRGVTD